MQEWHPSEVTNGMIKMGFHRPLCTSVKHLHMHILVGERKFKARI